jgi:hypothetical protein
MAVVFLHPRVAKHWRGLGCEAVASLNCHTLRGQLRLMGKESCLCDPSYSKVPRVFECAMA